MLAGVCAGRIDLRVDADWGGGNRLRAHVFANGGVAAGYGFDALGNLQTTHYGNGVTNLCHYDSQNHLTNQVWKSGGTTLAIPKGLRLS